MSYHTRPRSPLPWRAYDRGIGYEVLRADIDESINGEFRETLTKADAEFIVLACNNHQYLVDACKFALERIESDISSDVNEVRILKHVLRLVGAL